ncbi:MAG TPA: 3'-5' exonuclease, partial [Thermoanaerobaculia bacterium]|nr:3'-5' exonuclease [Thermoanaerobaculia bacterium]
VDLLAVLRAIAYGYDRGSLISAARSPYFALTDSEIAAGVLGERPSRPQSASVSLDDLASATARDARSLRAGRPLSDDDGPWKPFIESMRALRAESRNLTVTATIDHVIATTGIEAVYDDRSLRNLEQVRAIAFTYDQKAGGSLRQFVEEIARRRETPDEVDASLLDDTTNAVRILTIHGAKGLEFDRVILPDIEFTTNSSGVDLFTVEEPRSLVLRNGLETLSGVCRYSDNRPLKEIGSLRDKAETRRLFYVLITRAKSQVVICLNAKKVTNNGFGRFVNELFPQRVVQEVCGPALAGRPAEAGPHTELAPCVVPMPQPIIEKLTPAEIKTARAGMANRAAGILLHRVLERWDGKSDVAPLIAALAIEQAADERAIDVVRRRIAQISGSPTLQRILAAETIGREMPVAFLDESGSLVERRIDRLVREGGSDIVIDYKSGEPGEARIARDRDQVALYCGLVSQMTGRPCAGLLWYIDVENDQAIMV